LFSINGETQLYNSIKNSTLTTEKKTNQPGLNAKEYFVFINQKIKFKQTEGR
jgi:hypothetical protein